MSRYSSGNVSVFWKKVGIVKDGPWLCKQNHWKRKQCDVLGKLKVFGLHKISSRRWIEMRQKMLSNRQTKENFVCPVKELGVYSLGMGNPWIWADEWHASSKVVAKNKIPCLSKYPINISTYSSYFSKPQLLLWITFKLQISIYGINVACAYKAVGQKK